MSASKNKKQRLNATVDPKKAEEEAKRIKENKKYKTIGICVAVLFVLSIAFILLFNTIMYNWLPAVSVNGRNFSAAEFNFFYMAEYNELANSSAESKPTTGYSFREQKYDDLYTWYDYLKNEAKTALTQYTAIYNEAQAKGYVLPDEEKANIETEITSLRNAAASSNVSTKAYLENVYGTGMTESVYRKCLEFYTYVSSYYSHIVDTFQYTDDELAAEYAEIADDYDYFSFDLFFVEADMGTEEEPISFTNAMAGAKEEAEMLKAHTADEASFVAAVQDYYNFHAEEGGDPQTASADSLGTGFQGRYVSMIYSWADEWLKDAAREAGDVEIFPIGESEEDTRHGYYVVLFKERDTNDYAGVKATMIAISPETVTKEEGETDEAYALRQAAAEQAADSKIGEIKAAWESGAYATTDDLIAAFSEDIGDNHNDYDALSKHDLYDSFNDWLFDEARAENDSLTITEGSYRYLLIYKGHSDILNKFYAKNSLDSKNFTAWAEGVAVGYEAKEHWAQRYTGGIYYERSLY